MSARPVHLTTAFALALGLCLAAPAAALELEDVLRGLRTVSERHATFQETKRMALLNGPLVRKGSLLDPLRNMRESCSLWSYLWCRGCAARYDGRCAGFISTPPPHPRWVSFAPAVQPEASTPPTSGCRSPSSWPSS